DRVVKEIDALNAEIVRKQADLAKQMALSANAATASARTEASKAASALETQIAETQVKISGLRGQVEQEVQKMALVQDAVLGEAIRRTGISYDTLKGQVSAASRSAINDVVLIAENLDKLREQGLNTGLALGAALSRAISESESEQALDEVRSKVKLLRTELDEKVVDGLLNEATMQSLKLKDSLDDATAGVNSVREAFREFGLKTRDEYQAIADRQKAAFDQMLSSGQATTSQLSQAFLKYAESAIAANGGVADGFVRSQAAIRGFEIVTDEAGKTVVKAMKEIKDSTDRLDGSARRAAGGYRQLGDAAEEAGQRALQSIEQQIAATRRLTQEQASARDAALSEARGAPVNSTDNLGGVGIKAYSKENIRSELERIGYDPKRAIVEAARIFQGYIDDESKKATWNMSLSNAGYVDAELMRLAQYSSAGIGGRALTQGAMGDFGSTGKTTNVNITAGGRTVQTSVPSDQETDFLSILEQSQRLT
ncbi:MAG: hypothetical protein VXW65_11875, partial [Pseudomonadota bacterium]|nr:hypothetical protein [Pseudomonadota bacterium]